MAKFPLLEQLRADRERMEDEVRAPLVADLQRLEWHFNIEQEKRKAAERTLDSVLGKPISEQVARELGGVLAMAIYREIGKALPNIRNGEPIPIMLPFEIVQMMGDPDALAGEVMRQYRRGLPVKLTTLAPGPMSIKGEKVTLLRASLPEVHAQITIAA